MAILWGRGVGGERLGLGGLLSQPAFEYQAGGAAVGGMLAEVGVALLLPDFLLGFKAGQPLVHHIDRDIKASFDPIAKLACTQSHVAVAAVHVQRLADHDQIGLPFEQKLFDDLPVGNAVLCGNRFEFASLVQQIVGKGDMRAQMRQVYGNIAADQYRIHRDLTLPEVSTPFPWRNVYPQPVDNLASIPATSLAQAVKQARTMSKDRVTLFFNGYLDVSATSEESGIVRTSITDDYQHTGADVEISINPRYLIEALSGMDGEIIIQATSANRPIIITDGKREAVIMPLAV